MIKGYRIVGLRSIDLPSNWISIHPVLGDKKVRLIYKRCEKTTQHFAENLLNNKKDFKAACDIIQDCLIAPISLLYFIMGRFVFAKSFYADSSCTTCNKCIRNCPVKAIIMVKNQPFWTYRCESCMKCMNTCPARAIQTGHGYLAGTLFVINAWVLVHLWKIIPRYSLFDNHPMAFRLLSFMAECGVTLALISLVYRMIHVLKRVVVVRQIIEYSSLTTYLPILETV